MSDDLKKVRISLERQPLLRERLEIAQKKKTRKKVFIAGLICLIIGAEIGLIFGSGRKDYYGTYNESYSKYETIMSIMGDYWLYGNDYENLKETLEDNAYYGMTTFYNDPYTTYQSNKEMNDFADSINMNFVGVGISYVMIDDTITIKKVYKDSPAERAGLIAGDLIETIDRKTLDNLDTAKIREMVLGEEGTVVTFGINRQGEKMNIDIIRGKVDTTCYAYVEDETLILEISSFGLNTHDEIVKYLDNYKDYDSIIIDLRGNTGGYQSSVEEIAGLFLEPGSLVMVTVDKNGETKNSYVDSKVYYDNFKEIAILINDTTANAAEVLTMCLVEEHPNAYTIGETSYGKGVVQTTINMTDGSAVKVTTSKWLSPEGKWINGVGIKPDYEVLLHDVLYEPNIMMDDNDQYVIDSVSDYIRIGEKALDYLGYHVDRMDGYFDESFRVALNEFKKDHDLDNPNILNSNTYRAIISALNRQYATDPQKDAQLLKAIELINE